MAAPRQSKLPNFKYYEDKDGKPVFIDPVKLNNRRMVGRDSKTLEILVDSVGNPIPYKRIDLPNWVN